MRPFQRGQHENGLLGNPKPCKNEGDPLVELQENLSINLFSSQVDYPRAPVRIMLERDGN